MKKSSISFEAIILQHNNINAAFVEFPFSTIDLFGKKGQVKIKAIFDEKVEYRGSLAKMGGNQHRLGITQNVRKSLGKNFGDSIKIELWEDFEERIVEIPKDVEDLFSQHKKAKENFISSSYTTKKELIRWITDAKKIETRERRKLQMIEKLSTKS